MTTESTKYYIIEFFNGSESWATYEQYSGTNPQQAVNDLKRDYPLANIQNVAQIINWE